MLADLTGRHRGETAWIVGKGPSLVHLRREHFGPGPILAINQAISVIQDWDLPNPIYSLQKDGHPKDMVRPREFVTLILHKPHSDQHFKDHGRRIVVTTAGLGSRELTSMSIRMAVAIVKLMGVSKINFVCCDNLVNKDQRRVDVARMRVVGHAGGISYTNVREKVFEDLGDMPYQLVMPAPRGAGTCDGGSKPPRGVPQ